MAYYISVQYSAIQAAILRHDRLWSMAGTSLLLAELNEKIFPECANEGQVLVCGGGKFTARFDDKEVAENSRRKILTALITTFPMLEFQSASEPIEGVSLKEVKNRLIHPLEMQRLKLRGSGVSFNPHVRRCAECGEYPAEARFQIKKKEVCSFCHDANTKCWDLRTSDAFSTGSTALEYIMAKYFTGFKSGHCPYVPLDFENIFDREAEDEDGREIHDKKRLAVWFSDINNMGSKIPLWLFDTDDTIAGNFEKIGKVFTDTVIATLLATFPPQALVGRKYLPFRLLVAAGDDLWIVMDEANAVDFAINTAQQTRMKAQVADDHPLSPVWLKRRATAWREEQKTKSSGEDMQTTYGAPCFGAGLVITATHTSFRAVHQLAECLMKDAKTKSMRADNALTWRIMAEDASLAESSITFHKPLFICRDGEPNRPALGPSLEDYRDMVLRVSMSDSHVQQVAGMLFEHAGRPYNFERALMRMAATGLPKPDFDTILTDSFFRTAQPTADAPLDLGRVATFLELHGLIQQPGNGGEQ